MPPLDFKLKQPSATLMVAISAAFPVTSLAAGAGRIDFAVGDVKAVAADGRSRSLGKGAEVSAGEMIDTGSGRAQVRFSDGAQVSLQPQTQFRIDEYRFSGRVDGEERGFFSLIKGGLRTITGLVGRANRDNYKVTTSVATIGIRGTEYSLAYGNSITVTTGEGSVEVCNAAGCLILNSGETGYVADSNVQPVMSERKADVPPPPTGQEAPKFSVMETTDSSGSVSILGGTMVSGPGYRAAWAYDGGEGGVTVGSGVGSAVFSGNTLSRLELTSGAAVSAVGASLGAGDGIIGWGRWEQAGGDDGSGTSMLNAFHYVVGVPTATAEIASLSGTINFSLLGATAPSSESGSVGGVSTGSLTANFSGGEGNLSFALGMTSGLNVTGTGSVAAGSAGFSGSTSCSGTGCSCGGSGGFTGFFAGSNAARAGLSYDVWTDGFGKVWGAAAFRR